MKSTKLRRYSQIALLILAAGSIYTLPYLSSNFQNTILEVFDIKLSDFTQLKAIMGTMFVIGYFPSGWLADRIQVKYLVVVSMLITGAAGIYMATIPTYQQLQIVYLVWGFSTVLTFWSSLLKAINLLATKDEQAKAFGFLEGGRGLVEAALASIAVSIFAAVLSGSEALADTTRGLQTVILMYSFFDILIGILLLVVMKTTKGQDKLEEKVKSKLSDFAKDFAKVFAKKEVWILGFIIFCGYSVFWTTYYLGGFLQTTYGLTAVQAGTITSLMMWMRPIGGIGGGFIADKIGKERMLAISLLGAIIGLVILCFIPQAAPIIILGIATLFVGLMAYSVRGLYWSLLDSCRLEPRTIGLAIGLVSFVGYLPDIIIPNLLTPLFKAYNDGSPAYIIFFLGAASIGVIGIFVILYFKKTIQKKEIALEKQSVLN